MSEEINQLYPSRVDHLFDPQRLKEWKSRKPFHFKRGEQVSYPGGLEREILLIVEGSVRMFHLHRDGKECVLGILTADDFIDLPSVFIDRESDAFSVALTPVTVVKVPTREVMEEVKGNPELAVTLLTHLSNRMRDVIHILEQVAYEKVEERLLTTLKKLQNPAEEQDGWFPLPPYLTHRDLAGMVASTRETITFLLNKLSQNGIVRHRDNQLWLRKCNE